MGLLASGGPLETPRRAAVAMLVGNCLSGGKMMTGMMNKMALVLWRYLNIGNEMVPFDSLDLLSLGTYQGHF